MEKTSFRKTFLNFWTMAFLNRLRKILGIIKTWSNITFEGITYSRDWENWDQGEQASIPWLSTVGPLEDSNVWVLLWPILWLHAAHVWKVNLWQAMEGKVI